MTTYFIETDDGARKGPYATREAAREAISHESPNWVWIVDREPYADPAPPVAAELKPFRVLVRGITSSDVVVWAKTERGAEMKANRLMDRAGLDLWGDVELDSTCTSVDEELDPTHPDAIAARSRNDAY